MGDTEGPFSLLWPLEDGEHKKGTCQVERGSNERRIFAQLSLECSDRNSHEERQGRKNPVQTGPKEMGRAWGEQKNGKFSQNR